MNIKDKLCLKNIIVVVIIFAGFIWGIYEYKQIRISVCFDNIEKLDYKFDDGYITKNLCKNYPFGSECRSLKSMCINRYK